MTLLQQRLSWTTDDVKEEDFSKFLETFLR